jgi:DNA-binding NtrC family response regulator
MPKHRHVLVVDHHGDLRQVVSDMLLDLGYRVSLAKDGDGMRAFLETADFIDVIILDASASADEAMSLAEQARSQGVRLVMISGQPHLMIEYHDRADQLLHKPFGRNDLERAMTHALASGTFGQRSEDPD